MWEIELYEKPNGRCPVREFLEALNPKDERPHVVNAIGQLEEHGNKLRRPQVEYLGEDIYELRVKTRSRNVRVFYFFFDGKKIVLTHGMIKKMSDVPAAEIKKAVEYRREYLGRERGKAK